MKYPKNRRTLENVFRDAVSKDRARSRIGRISQFGIIEMTRQRLGPSIRRFTHIPCEACNAQAWVRSIESMTLSIMRKIKLGVALENVKHIVVTANPELALNVTTQKRKELHFLEEQTKTKITVTPFKFHLIEIFKVEFFDQHNQLISVDEHPKNLHLSKPWEFFDNG
jgi:ribonuclease E